MLLSEQNGRTRSTVENSGCFLGRLSIPSQYATPYCVSLVFFGMRNRGHVK